ncbi:MAG: hypothetical protein NXI20_01160 [bacterium]|jgi:hypothetical protein|nr:hypothetical protein [bacterium]
MQVDNEIMSSLSTLDMKQKNDLLAYARKLTLKQQSVDRRRREALKQIREAISSQRI